MAQSKHRDDQLFAAAVTFLKTIFVRDITGHDAPGATGVGGAAIVTGGDGGSTSGDGGDTGNVGGNATAGDSRGGDVDDTGGVGQGSSRGGHVLYTGGQAGATGKGGGAAVIAGASGATSGAGGTAQLTGGAASGGDANGGSTIVSAGAKDGTGLDGVLCLNPLSLPLLTRTPAPTTSTTGTTWSAADMTGSPVHEKTPVAAQNFTTATGAELSAIFPSLVVGDAFQVALINLGGNDNDLTILAGASGMTLVGKMIIASLNDVSNTYEGSALFQCRNTGANTWTLTRIG